MSVCKRQRLCQRGGLKTFIADHVCLSFLVADTFHGSLVPCRQAGRQGGRQAGRQAGRAGRAGRVGRADRPFFCIALVLLRAYKRRRSGRQERTGRGDRKGRSRSDMHGVGFPTRQWQLLRSIGTDRFFFLHVPSVGIAAFFCIAATSFKRTVMSSAFFASWHSKV